MKKSIAFAMLLAALLVAAPGTAHALKCHADMGSIKINALPGQIVNRSFRLTLDPTEQRTQFKAHVEDWWHSEDGKQSFYKQPGTLKHSCAPWIKLNPVEAAVEPGAALDVKISVAIPSEVEPGGYWCALTVDEVPDPLKIRPEGVGVRFVASISVGIFIYVSPLNRSAKITDLQVAHEQASVRLRNDGNCPLAIEGHFEFLRPGATEPVASVALARNTLLPEPIPTILIAAALPDAKTLPAGRYLVRVILDVGAERLIGAQKEMEISRETPPSPPVATAAR